MTLSSNAECETTESDPSLNDFQAHPLTASPIVRLAGHQHGNLAQRIERIDQIIAARRAGLAMDDFEA
jgi:hypothetical protein